MREPVSDGELEALVQTLAAYPVDYLLIGGQAARLHGVQHPSYDRPRAAAVDGEPATSL